MSFSRLLTLLLAPVCTPLLFGKSSSGAPVSVKGYVRSNGTYVVPYVRSAPNGTTADNYSTKGNVNPYTGQPGTKNPAPGDAIAAPVSTELSATTSGVPANPLGLTPSASAATSPAVVSPSVSPQMSDRDVMMLLLAKVLAIETRLASVEDKQSAELSKLRTEVQAAFDVVGAELIKKEGAVAPISRPQGSTLDTQSVSIGNVPSVAQWRKLEAFLTTPDQVEKILGKPKKIENKGSGEIWTYEGGGYVTFTLGGRVNSFGGYSAGK